jgi:hypothetical protein
VRGRRAISRVDAAPALTALTLCPSDLRWPQGGAKFQTIGNVVYGFLVRRVFGSQHSASRQVTEFPVCLDDLRQPRACRFAGLRHCAADRRRLNQILIVESIRSLATHRPEDDDDKLHIPSLIAVGIALGAFTGRSCLCSSSLTVSLLGITSQRPSLRSSAIAGASRSRRRRSSASTSCCGNAAPSLTIARLTGSFGRTTGTLTYSFEPSALS